MRISLRMMKDPIKPRFLISFSRPLELGKMLKYSSLLIYQKPRMHFCTNQQNNQKDLLQTSQSMMAILLQKSELETALDLLSQIAFALNTLYIQQDPKKSKKIINFILQTTITISQADPSLYLNKFEEIYSLITEKIEFLDQVELISDIYSIYLAIIQKKEGKNSNKYARNLSKLGQIFLFAQQNTKAEKCIKEVLQIYKDNTSIMNPEQIVQIYINLGLVTNNLKQSDESLLYYQKAIKICQSDPNLEGYESPIYELMGDQYLELQQYQSSKQYYELSLESNHNRDQVDANYLNLVFKILRVAKNLQNYDEANRYCDQILAQLENSNNLKNQFQYENQLLFIKARCAQKLNHLEQAIDFFSKYKHKLEKSLPQNQSQYISTLLQLFQLRSRLGDTQKALGHLKQIKKHYRLQGNQEKLEQYEQKIKQFQKHIRRNS